MLLANRRRNGREITFGAGLQDKNLAAKSVCSGLEVGQLRLGDRIIWICKYANDGSCRS
jgi:hypothetical protein